MSVEPWIDVHFPCPSCDARGTVAVNDPGRFAQLLPGSEQRVCPACKGDCFVTERVPLRNLRELLQDLLA